MGVEAVPTIMISMECGSVTGSILFSGPVAWLIGSVIAVVFLGGAIYLLVRECKKLHHKME